MLPTLRQLQYLKLLVEHGSFSRAAEAAHVTQPTLSAGVQELEKILGAAVVDRARSGVILTKVGEEAVRRAADVLARAEDLVQAAHSAGRPLSGRFRLGVIPTIAPFMLPKTLPVIRDRFPDLRLFLREDQTAKLLAALKAGALDAALIALPFDAAGIDTAHIEDDELLAAIPANHPLLTASSVTPEELDHEGLILLEDGHCLREHALAACSLEGAESRRGRLLRRHLARHLGSDGGLRPRCFALASHGGSGRPDQTLLPLLSAICGTGRQRARSWWLGVLAPAVRRTPGFWLRH